MLLRVSLKRLHCWPDFNLLFWHIVASKLLFWSIYGHVDIFIFFFLLAVVVVVAFLLFKFPHHLYTTNGYEICRFGW